MLFIMRVYFQAFFADQIPATECIVLYSLSITALQKDDGYFPSAAVL